MVVIQRLVGWLKPKRTTDLQMERRPRRVSETEVGRVFEGVCDLISGEFGVPRDALLSRLRTAEVSEARQAAYYILRKRYGLTFAQIGRLFGRNHSTVLHGVRAASMRGRVDKDYASPLDWLVSSEVRS